MSVAAPTVPRAIEHPSCRVPVLSWWRGVYDHVFIALHPFYRVPIKGAPPESGRPKLENTDGWSHQPRGFGDVIKADAQSITWAAIHGAAAPDEPQERVYRAIWLLSCLGFAERADTALQRCIESHCVASRIHLPLDDSMPPNLEADIGRFLGRLGRLQVTAWDQFRDNSIDVPLSAFLPDRPSIRLANGLTGPGVFGLHLPGDGVLLTWAFDCTEALIALTDKALSRARPEKFFEGWYADATTYCDVFNPHEFAPRDE